MKRRLEFPPIPPKLQVPDGEALRMLGLSVNTPQGRAQAHQTSDYLEKLVDVYDHNTGVARVALRQIREALQEIQA